MSEPIDTTLDNADGNQDGQELDANGQPIVKAEPPAFDWENEANPYRKRYSDSQSQIQPLVRKLSEFAEFDHDTKQWKPKTSPVVTQGDDFEKTMEGYDPEFRKALQGYTQKQIKEALAEFKKESAFLSEYNSGVQSGRSKAMEEFGDEFGYVSNGKMNTASPLYQLANEIVINKYASFNPDGTFAKYTNPEAEYLATVEAYAILVKRSKSQTQDKGKLNAIQGRGTKASGVKKDLSYEEYSKLSTTEKDAYDLTQSGGQR